MPAPTSNYKVYEFNFASGATAATETHTMRSLRGAILHVPAEFNSDTITFRSVGGSSRWGTNNVFTKSAATGANPLTAAEVQSLIGIGQLTIVTNNATGAAAKAWLECRS